MIKISSSLPVQAESMHSSLLPCVLIFYEEKGRDLMIRY